MNQQESKINYFPTHFNVPRDEVLFNITNAFEQKPQSRQPLIENFKGMKIVCQHGNGKGHCQQLWVTTLKHNIA